MTDPLPPEDRQMTEEQDQSRVDGQPDSNVALPQGSNEAVPAKPQYRIWAMQCPFRKTGSPVLGTFGASIRGVVIFDVATWKRLCQDVPQLQTTMFEVGSYED